GQLNNKPLFFISGNHDFIPHDKMETILRNHDIEAYSLDNKLIKYNDFKFYGFPYIPYICGDWNNELNTDQMRSKADQMVSDIKNQDIDILVTHSPPNGIG